LPVTPLQVPAHRYWENLIPKVVTSLEFAINNPESEMEHPCEWIATNPDFGCLRSPQDESWWSSRNSLLPRSGEIFRR